MIIAGVKSILVQGLEAEGGKKNWTDPAVFTYSCSNLGEMQPKLCRGAAFVLPVSPLQFVLKACAWLAFLLPSYCAGGRKESTPAKQVLASLKAYLLHFFFFEWVLKCIIILVKAGWGEFEFFQNRFVNKQYQHHFKQLYVALQSRI